MSDAADEVKDLIEKSRRLLDQANEFAARYEQLTSELREILAKLEQERRCKYPEAAIWALNERSGKF